MAISLAHKSVTIDVNDRNAPNIVAIVNVSDKATRYLDVTLTASGEKLTFTDCTVTATFATDGYLISDAIVCTLNDTADVITVPLENFKSMSGFLAIEIKIANGETQVLNTPLTLKVKVTPSLAENSKINNESIGSFVDISREVAAARGEYANLGTRLDKTDTALTAKANKSDISQINSRLQSAEMTLKNKANTADVDNSLANKYDSSNIESGSATLTPYSSQTDKSKSAVCTYKKVGDTLLATVTITLNAGTLGANSTLHFIDLPFRHNSDTPVYFTGISSKGGVFKGVVPKTSTWLSIMSTITQTYTFTDGEQLNFTLMYKI